LLKVKDAEQPQFKQGIAMKEENTTESTTD